MYAGHIPGPRRRADNSSEGEQLEQNPAVTQQQLWQALSQLATGRSIAALAELEQQLLDRFDVDYFDQLGLGVGSLLQLLCAQPELQQLLPDGDPAREYSSQVVPAEQDYDEYDLEQQMQQLLRDQEEEEDEYDAYQRWRQLQLLPQINIFQGVDPVTAYRQQQEQQQLQHLQGQARNIFNATYAAALQAMEQYPARGYLTAAEEVFCDMTAPNPPSVAGVGRADPQHALPAHVKVLAAAAGAAGAAATHDIWGYGSNQHVQFVTRLLELSGQPLGSYTRTLPWPAQERYAHWQDKTAVKAVLREQRLVCVDASMLQALVLWQMAALRQEQRDGRNRATGCWGEQLVALYLTLHHASIGSGARVDWVNAENESGKPFDIIVTHPDGTEDWLEVKTTGDSDSFMLTDNELEAAKQKREHYQVVRVWGCPPKSLPDRPGRPYGAAEEACQLLRQQAAAAARPTDGARAAAAATRTGTLICEDDPISRAVKLNGCVWLLFMTDPYGLKSSKVIQRQWSVAVGPKPHQGGVS